MYPNIYMIYRDKNETEKLKYRINILSKYRSDIINSIMISFCKICSNLNTYTHTPERKMIMKCQSCGRIDENIKDICIYFNKFVQSSYDIKIDPDQCHDPTLPITDQVPCRNTATCPSNNPGYSLLVQEKLEELGETVTPEAIDTEFMVRRKSVV